MTTSEIHGPQYKPSSVTVEHRNGYWCVIDGSYAEREIVTKYQSFHAARDAAKVRRATIKGALTRRRNKHIARRAAALEEAGVTWSWLTKDMTPAEADAWLGLD